ncbi:MAG: metallophosphoesterase [Candidatus Micrarchaeota archaeon]
MPKLKDRIGKLFKKQFSTAKIRILKEGGVYFDDLGILAITDLQLGHEAVLHNRGVDVPLEQFPIILERIESMLLRTKAERVLINGDMKHEFSHAMQQEWDEVLELLKFFKKREVELILVRGNHDNYVAKILRNQNLKLHDYFLEKGILFIHGHKKLGEYGEFPELKEYSTLVIGHVHPAVSLHDEVGVPHKYNCLLKGEFQGKELLVLPSISPLASGADLVSRIYETDTLSPILDECDIGDFVPVVIDPEGGVKEFPKIRYL